MDRDYLFFICTPSDPHEYLAILDITVNCTNTLKENFLKIFQCPKPALKPRSKTCRALTIACSNNTKALAIPRLWFLSVGIGALQRYCAFLADSELSYRETQ